MEYQDGEYVWDDLLCPFIVPNMGTGAVVRECHGFSNPHGSQVGVVTGAGAGWKFTPLKNPHPCHGFEGF